MAHAFNPSTWEAEAGRFLSSKPAWSTKWVQGQPGLNRETLSQIKQKQIKKKKKSLAGQRWHNSSTWEEKAGGFLSWRPACATWDLAWEQTSQKPEQPMITSTKETRSGVVVHAFNPSTREAEAGGFLSSRPVWSTEWVPGQPGLHRETLSRKTKPKQNKKQTTTKNNRRTFSQV